jgi:hypothetical protein
MFAMTAKRFWMLMTFGGGLLFVGGIVATIWLTVETGEKRPDYECGAVQMVCYTSDDPAVLLGLAPTFAGGGMLAIGVWKWNQAARSERALGDSDPSDLTPPPPSPPPSDADPAKAENPLEAYEKLRAKGKRGSRRRR